MERRFEGKVALVTGGAGGQGAIEVKRFAAEGARAYACDLRDDQEVPAGVEKLKLDEQNFVASVADSG